LKTGCPFKKCRFFDVEKFKKINFTAGTLVEVNKNRHYELYGELTMKGIRKQIKLDVEFGGLVKDPWGRKGIVPHYRENKRQGWD
jgi:polyisoprenoid-binding protein YceI